MAGAQQQPLLAAGEAPITLSLVAHDELWRVDDDTNAGVAISGSAQAGDLCLIFCRDEYQVSGTGGAAPADFTTLLNNKYSSPGGVIYCRDILCSKILTAADAGKTKTFTSGMHRVKYSTLIFRPSRAAAFSFVGSLNYVGVNSNPPVQTVLVASSTTKSGIAVAYWFQTGAGYAGKYASISLTEYDIPSDVTGNAGGYAGFKIFNPDDAKANFTVDLNDFDNFNTLCSFYLQAS